MLLRHKTNHEQILRTSIKTTVESHHNSHLPVSLTSPDMNNVRLSFSRAITPEQRNSISLMQQKILLILNEIIDLNELDTNYIPSNSMENIVLSEGTARLKSVSSVHILVQESTWC